MPLVNYISSKKMIAPGKYTTCTQSGCQAVASISDTNLKTLISTKASRMFYASNGEPILEFGLRRAQGIDGSLSASRASYIGGCSKTSNVLAGKIFNIPVNDRKRFGGKSKFNFNNRFWVGIIDLIKVRILIKKRSKHYVKS